MPVKTVLNAKYLEDVVWEVRTNLNGLNERAGLSGGYIYRLTSEGGDISLSTVDKIHNALESMMIEQGINPPDTLWERILVHEEQ